ncbi:MAG TPA: hypothetical protein VEU30_09635 [Thermoanaerobaculia bacterium]|nr:hypothetical protein [Thermoanaerobaculia bacterium]
MNRIAIACALLIAAAASAQQQQGTVPARNRIEIDLRSTGATGTVPFDTPFEMVGDVPDRVERIELIYRDCRDGKCPTAGNIARNANCEPMLDDRAKWQPANEPLIWQRDALLAPAAGQLPRFSLPIDALEAQREYVFLFDIHGTPTAEQMTTFQTNARAAVSRRIAEVTSSDQTKQAYVNLRNDLIAEARRLAPCVVVDRLLAEDTDIDERFTTAIAELIDDQQQKADSVSSFNEAAVRMRTNLTAIVESPLSLLVRRLRTLSATRPEVAADLEAHNDVVKFISLTPVQMEAVARGASPVTPDRTIQSMLPDVTAADATARVTNLALTRDLLRSLSDWLKRLDRDKTFDELQTSGDLSAENVTAIRALATPRTGSIDLAASDAFRMVNLGRTIAEKATTREARVDALADAARQEIRAVRLIGSDTVGTFDTFANWYISADAGFAYSQEAEATVPYLGTNIYFRPINKDVPLQLKGGLKRRVSATFGLTVSSISDSNSGRQDLFNTQSLLAGGGFRLTDMIRLGGGVLVYKRANGTSAPTSTSVEVAPYVSVSFDWNVAKQFAGVGKLFQ